MPDQGRYVNTVSRNDLRQLADALETAYGCLDLMRMNVKPIDLADCIVEVIAARDKALGLMERRDD